MSHFTKVETKIKNLVSLKAALKDLGYEFTEAEQGVEVRGYLGAKTKADLCIRASKTYDVGVVATATGYEFVADWWGVETTRGVTQEEFVKQVTQRYAYHQVLSEVAKMGYTIETDEVKEDQTISLTVRKWQ
ncbi:DUF1257 domain-containing protein [Myxococcota bacterium]|nr:DUF1257 domain-containing protein [Myxococcota bacterium]MBU1429263.1 DUF1257 domain-containing protein [Myxococcota bacterium]MBU1897360.1 DUF1257 domain-containing protein [Myxococcota bacterium]